MRVYAEKKEKGKRKKKKIEGRSRGVEPNECEGNHKRDGLCNKATKRRTGTCKNLGRRLNIMGIGGSRAESYGCEAVNPSSVIPCRSLPDTLQIDQVLCPITVFTRVIQNAPSSLSISPRTASFLVIPADIICMCESP